jgi:hypothetical protein
MRVFIPDYAPIELGESKTVEEARRILVDQGYTTVAGAKGRVDGAGDIHFERNAGGEKAAV